MLLNLKMNRKISVTILCNIYVISTTFEEEDCDLSHVEVDEVLGFVGDVGAEVPTDDAVPCGVVLLIELLFDEGLFQY